MSDQMAPDYANPKHRNQESPQKELTVITLKIELPTEFAVLLSEDYWTRLEILIGDALRMNEPTPASFYPSVWRER
jgi:hypothetical protein